MPDDEGHAVSEDSIMQTTNNTKRVEAMSYSELFDDRGALFAAQQADSDFLADSLLENMNASPLGQLLKVIGSLPEVRVEKVDRARRMINRSDSGELDAQMDIALDRVLEELIIEG